MTQLLRRSPFLLLLLAFVPSVRAAEPLEQVPGDAAVAIRFASVDKYLGNFSDLLAGIGPVAVREAGPEIEDGLGDILGVDGDGLDVFNRDSPVYLAVFPIFDRGEEPHVIFAQVKDQDGFRKALLKGNGDIKTEKLENGFEKISREGAFRSYYIAARGDYTLYTPGQKAMEKLAAKTDPAKSFAATLDPRAKELLTTGDVALAVHVAVLTEKFRGEIEGAKDEALREIDGIDGDALGTGDPEATKKLLKSFVEFGFETAFDVTWFAGHASFSAEGAQGEGLVMVKEGSASDTRLASAPPDALEILGLLPKGNPAYFGLHLPPEFSKVFSDAFMMLSYGSAVKDAGQMKEGVELMQAAKLTTIASAFALPKDDKTGITSVTLEMAGDARKMMQGWQKVVQAMGELKTPYLNQTLSYEQNAARHKDHEIDLMTTEFSVGDGEAAVILKAFFEVLFGGMTYEARLAAIEELLVQVGGNDPSLIGKVIDSLGSGEDVVALESAYGATRDKLL